MQWITSKNTKLLQIMYLTEIGIEYIYGVHDVRIMDKVHASGPLTLGGRAEIAAILQTFSDAFSLMKMYEFWTKFRWSLFLRVQLTIFQHWFR